MMIYIVLMKKSRARCQCNICVHLQGYLHQSPSTPGRAPSCPLVCSPSFPEPRSASLYLYVEPGWLAHSALHPAGKGSKTMSDCSNTKHKVSFTVYYCCSLSSHTSSLNEGATSTVFSNHIPTAGEKEGSSVMMTCFLR